MTHSFSSARLKLTLWYVLILFIVTGLFSFIIFHISEREVERFATIQSSRLSRQLPFSYSPAAYEIREQFISDARKNLIINLFTANLAILCAGSALAYFLAGSTLRPLALAMEEQSQFISDASHELKTPLTSLKTSLEVYLRSPTTTKSEADSLITENLAEVNHLQHLAESLLTLARTNSTISPPQAVSLAKLFLHTRKILLPQSEQKHITISIPKTKLKLFTSEVELTKILLILLDNAIKYSKNNSRVRLKAEKRVQNILISVIDSGIGISEPDQKKIFNRFYRADTSRSVTPGFGLGLSIAQLSAKNLGGKITVQSKLGSGSTFTLTLPIRS